MIHITEAQSGAIISHELAFKVVRRAFLAASTPAAMIFPVVFGSASDSQNKFTVKSAADGSLAGLKVGSYFPTNDAAGLLGSCPRAFVVSRERQDSVLSKGTTLRISNPYLSRILCMLGRERLIRLLSR